MKQNKILSQILKYSLFISFPLIIILFLFISQITSLYDRNEIQIIKGDLVSQLEVLKDVISDDFNSITSDLQIISESEILNDYIFNENKITFNRLKSFLFSYSSRKKTYDQIRFIDLSGIEKVRINYNSGNPYFVEKKDLQTKNSRYYFKDVFELEKGEIFVSPLDLNIEQGIIEQPYKPMIRIGTPIYDSNNKKKGIVLINYLGETTLNSIKRYIGGFKGEIMLLNSDGYWILSPNPEDSWGFMFDDKKDKIFSNKFAEEWKLIDSSKNSQFTSSNGFFTFQTIYPIQEAWKSSSGAGTPFASSDYTIKGENYFWKLILYYPMEQLNLRLLPHRSNNRTLLYIISALIFAFSIFLSRAIVKRKLAETKK